MRLPVFVVKFHRWLGLVLGLQVVLWISGGLVMSAVPLERVRGEDRSQGAAPPSIPASTPLLSPTAAAKALGYPAVSGARLVWRLGHPAWRLETPAGAVHVDATTGNAMADLTAPEARAVAVADYSGDAPVASVALQEDATLEIRGLTPPLWRVDFADGRRTTIYVDPASGEIAARRNLLWRVYDVFWMLHIMDYRARDDFNHSLLVGSAATAWFLALTGLWLVVLWLRRRARRS